ncbi:MAG: hypothetical protein HYZ28_09340 [Myxococcales bacterium]|nr:hypothetical protein [Myxococcales bacterium]
MRAGLLQNALALAAAPTFFGVLVGACRNFDEDLAVCRSAGRCGAPPDGAVVSDSGSDSGSGGQNDGGTDGGTDGGAADGGIVAPSGLCSSAGICWENPLPQGNPLLAVWSDSPSDTWVAGLGGTLMHWDGGGWADHRVSGGVGLRGLWGDGAGRVWLVGEQGLLRRWNGSGWEDLPAPNRTFHDIRANGPAELWVAGDEYVHWGDGTSWNEARFDAGYFLKVWPADAGAYLADDVGRMFHFDSSARQFTSIAHDGGAIWDIWGDGERLWVAGDSRLVGEWTGVSWAWERWTSGTEAYRAIWGDGSGNLWLAGEGGNLLRLDGGGGPSWPPEPPYPPTLLDLEGSDQDNLWAVGTAGTVLQRSDGGWARHGSGPWSDLNAVACGSGRVLGFGPRQWIFERSSGGWVRSDLPVVPCSSCGDFYDALGLPDGGFVAVGGQIQAVYAGGQWYASPIAPGLFGVWASKDGELWGAGSGGLYSYSEVGNWELALQTPNLSLNDVFGNDQGEMWAVGTGGIIRHRIDGGWIGEDTGTTALYAVWGVGSEAWAVGEPATVLRRGASGWSQVPAQFDPGARFTGVWGSGPQDVWVIGTGLAYHFNGNQWSKVDVGTPNDLRGVCGDGKNVWMVGELGTVLRR